MRISITTRKTEPKPEPKPEPVVEPEVDEDEWVITKPPPPDSKPRRLPDDYDPRKKWAERPSPHGPARGFAAEAKANLPMRLMGVDEENMVIWMQVEGKESEFRPIDVWELDELKSLARQAGGLPLTFRAFGSFRLSFGLGRQGMFGEG